MENKSSIVSEKNRLAWSVFALNLTITCFLSLGLSAQSQAIEILPISTHLASQLKQRYGETALQRISSWQNLVDRNQHASISEKLDLVNRFFNGIRFVSDQAHWRFSDYWATPVELLASNGGDCEDFAIAKYFTLRAMGISVARLRLTYVKAIELNRAHMVLSYTPIEGVDPLVLDNLRGEILPASKRADLDPVYSFNADGLWLSKQKGETHRLGTGNDVTLWRELRDRIDLEEVLNDN